MIEIRPGAALQLFLLTTCLLVQLTLIPSANSDVEDTRTRIRPKYTEIRRAPRVQVSTTTTSAPILEQAGEADDEESDEEEEQKPRMFSNSRGGEFVPEESNAKTIVNETEKPDERRTASDRSRQPVSKSAAGRRYIDVDFLRPGAKERASRRRSTTTTTAAPPSSEEKESEEEDDSKRPDACNQCRFYCKRCRGAEEVTTGGVWGCCNHNCCGGRCSCQKVGS